MRQVLSFILSFAIVQSSMAVYLQVDNSIEHAEKQASEITQQVEVQNQDLPAGAPLVEAKAQAINFRKDKALNDTEMSQLWHLSEGADVYPLAWMIRLRSETLNECGLRNKGVGNYFLDDLDTKIGATYDPIPSKYPVRYIGLTAAWSSMKPEAVKVNSYDKSYHDYPSTEVAFGKDISTHKDDITSRSQWKQVLTQMRTQGSEIDEVKVLTSAQYLPEVQTNDDGTIQFDELALDSWVVRNNEHKSIAMSGTTCTFCHSGSIAKNKKEQVIIDGMPGLMSSGDFFTDMTLSTILTMANAEKMEKFLLSFPKVVERYQKKYPLARTGKLPLWRQKLRELSRSFVASYRSALQLEEVTGIKKLLKKVVQEGAENCFSLASAASGATRDAFREALYVHRDDTTKHLLRLVELTFDFSQTENAPANVAEIDVSKVSKTVASKMQWIAYVVGYNQQVYVDGHKDPVKLERSFQGRARTDAFGRVGNWLLPYHKQTHINAPASVPYMWGMEYRPMYNYPGNTNSVLIRNLLQSIGLGSTLPWYDRGASIDFLQDAQTESPWSLFATTNLHVMNHIEQLLYKIQIPSFWAIFGAQDVEPSYPAQNKVDKYDYYLEKNSFVEPMMGDNDSRIDIPDSEVEKAVRGCDIYQQTCYKCHDSRGSQVGTDYNARVGVSGADQFMIAEQLFPMDVLGDIDPQHAIQMARTIPLDKWAPDPNDEDKKFWASGATFGEFAWPAFELIEKAYFTRWVPEHEREDLISQWRRSDMRGPQVIRDGAYPKGKPMNVETIADQEPPYYARELQEPRHYIARHLSGIWASAPFLHNGSVPSIMQLLKPEHERPTFFITANNELDKDELGFKWRYQDHPQWKNTYMQVPFVNAAGSIWDKGWGDVAGIRTTPIHARRIAKLCRLYSYTCFFTEEFESDNSLLANKIQNVMNGFSKVGYLGAGNTLKGNSNKGHSGPGFTGWGYANLVHPSGLGRVQHQYGNDEQAGRDFTQQEREDLIAFLKVLQPEPEYAWNTVPVYQVNEVRASHGKTQRKCEIHPAYQEKMNQ